MSNFQSDRAISQYRDIQAASYTKTGQWFVPTPTINGDGSRSTAFVATGPTFPCNMVPTGGDEKPAPESLLDVNEFDVFVPYDQDPQPEWRIQIDGDTYEISDIEFPKSADVISIRITVTILT